MYVNKSIANFISIWNVRQAGVAGQLKRNNTGVLQHFEDSPSGHIACI